LKAAFHYTLINPPFEDPGLYILRRHERRALLFDLGNIRRLTPRQLLVIEHVFISHMHIDHFCGLDDLLRVCLGRPLTIHLYGPPGLIRCVEHKLCAYSWNLVHRFEEGLTLTVTELHDDRDTLERAQFRCQDAFALTPLPPALRDGDILMRDHRVCVRAVTLDHHIPCLGFCLEETTHVAIKKDHLARLGLPVGPWLQQLKRALLRHDPDDTLIPIPDHPPMTLATLRAECVLISPGPKLAYVTDVAFHAQNASRISALAHRADLMFIESSFTADEPDRAAERAHLTSYQAGTLARLSLAKRVIPFHFSPRHAHQAEQIYAEVQAAFLGLDDPQPSLLDPLPDPLPSSPPVAGPRPAPVRPADGGEL
jgi:ribonuclease Z